MSLTEKAKDFIRDSRELRAALIKENGISEFTLLRWLREDYKMLTTKSNLMLLEQYSGFKESEILEMQNA